jgi:Zn-dependent peptidase ImmA (M78 family)
MRVVDQSVRAFECPERQAHQFAAELLMPRRFLQLDMDVHRVMSDFGVSEEAATKRLKFIAALK